MLMRKMCASEPSQDTPPTGTPTKSTLFFGLPSEPDRQETYIACLGLATMSLLNMAGRIRLFTKPGAMSAQYDAEDEGEKEEELQRSQARLEARAAAMEALGLLGKQWQHAAASMPHPEVPLSVAQDAHVAGAQMLAWLLRMAMNKESVSCIEFLVFDVMYSLDVLAGLSNHGPRLPIAASTSSPSTYIPIQTQVLGEETSVLESVIAITAEWFPGKYSSQFTQVKGETHPILELATDILCKMSRSEHCRLLMQEENLVEILEKVRGYDERGYVKRYVDKLLWYVRDYQATLQSARSIVQSVDALQNVAERCRWNERQQAMHFTEIFKENTLEKDLSVSTQYLKNHVDHHHRLERIRMLWGTESKSLSIWFDSMRKGVTQRKRVIEHLLVRIREWERSLLLNAMETWHLHVQLMKAVSHERQRTSHMLATKSVFALWRLPRTAHSEEVDDAAKQNKVQGMCRNFVVRLMHRSSGLAFYSWAEKVKRSIRRRGILARAIRKLLNATLSAAWLAWGFQAKAHSRAQGIVIRALQRWTNGITVGAFESWHAYCRAKIKIKTRGIHVITRMLNRKVAIAWDSWYAHSMQQRNMRTICTKILKKMLNSKLASAFQKWMDYTKSHRRIVAVCRRSIVKLVNRRGCVAFDTWKDHSRQQVRAHGICSRALRHLMNRCAALAFERWRTHSKEQRRMKNLCWQMVRRMMNLAIAAAWEMWRDCVKKQQRGERICLRIACHWFRRTAAACFESWHIHALEQKRMEQVCSHIVIKMLNHCLDISMMTWKHQAREKKRMKGVCSKILLKLMHQCASIAFATWESHAREQKRAEGICARVLRHWIYRTSAACFKALYSHTQKQRRMQVSLSSSLSSLSSTPSYTHCPPLWRSVPSTIFSSVTFSVSTHMRACICMHVPHVPHDADAHGQAHQRQERICARQGLLPVVAGPAVSVFHSAPLPPAGSRFCVSMCLCMCMCIFVCARARVCVCVCAFCF